MLRYGDCVRTVIADPPPAEFEALLERRRRSRADTHDEIWEGVYHVTPAPSMAHALIVAQLAELLGPPARAARLAYSAEVNLVRAMTSASPTSGCTVTRCQASGTQPPRWWSK